MRPFLCLFSIIVLIAQFHTASAFSITNPSSGELLEKGWNYWITWTPATFAAHYEIYLTTDGDNCQNTCLHIGTSYGAINLWNISVDPNSNYQIVIDAYNNFNQLIKSAQSDTFSVKSDLAPSVHVISPRMEDSFERSWSIHITYQLDGGRYDHLSYHYSSDGGNTWRELGPLPSFCELLTCPPDGLGLLSYYNCMMWDLSCRLPQPTLHGKIRVDLHLLDGSIVSDMSDGEFTIEDNRGISVYLDDHEVFIGDTLDIGWGFEDITTSDFYYKVEIKRTPNSPLQPLTPYEHLTTVYSPDSVLVSGGTFRWKVTGPISPEVIVQVSESSDGTFGDPNEDVPEFRVGHDWFRILERPMQRPLPVLDNRPKKWSLKASIAALLDQLISIFEQ